MNELANYLSSLRARLAGVVQRRDDLQHQLGEVTGLHDRLVAAISFLEADLETESVSLSDVPEDPPPLVDQILAALPGATGKTRADLQELFRCRDINENTLDSALERLRKRGGLVKRGKYYFRSPAQQDAALPASASPPTPAPADRESARSSDAAGAGRVPGAVDSGEVDLALAGSASLSVPSDPALSYPAPVDKRAFTVRVYERIATLRGCTRADLVRCFGVEGKKVDDVLRAHRKRGRLKQRPDGMWVVNHGSDARVPLSDAGQAS